MFFRMFVPSLTLKNNVWNGRRGEEAHHLIQKTTRPTFYCTTSILNLALPCSIIVYSSVRFQRLQSTRKGRSLLVLSQLIH